MDPISLKQAGYALFLRVSQSWQTPQYWAQTIAFLIIFVGILALFTLPLTSFIKHYHNHPALIIASPLIGLVNLLLHLLLADNLITTAHVSPQQLRPIVAITFVIQYASVKWWLKRSRPPLKKTVPFHRYWWALLIALYLTIFIIVSALHFDPQQLTFFTPGIEINYDSMNIQSAVIHLERDILVSPNNLAGHLGGLSLTGYPKGSIMLLFFFTQLIHRPIFELYPLVLTASFLTVLFIIALLLKVTLRKPHPLIWLTLTASVINYLTLSYINTSVFASTVIIPILFFSLYLQHQLLRQPKSKFILILTCITLTAGVYMYSYIIVLFYLLAALPLVLKKNRRLILLVSLPVLISFANPINLYNLQNITKDQLTSADKETNIFKGMHGNLSEFVNPFMFASQWFSHPIYLVGSLRTGNSWFVAALGLSVLWFLTQAVPKKQSSSNSVLKTLGSPFLVLLVGTFLTGSPYQQAKVLQMAAPLLPLILYHVFQPYFSSTSITLLFNLKISQTKIATGLFSLIIVTMIGSGLYASSYIGTPVNASYQELTALDPELCSSPTQSITVIGRDEWAKNHLFSCQNIHYYFDRNVNWEGIIAFNRHNDRIFLSQTCTPDSLELVEYPEFQDDLLLVDRCIRYYPQNYTLEHEGIVYRHFKLMTLPAQTP